MNFADFVLEETLKPLGCGENGCAFNIDKNQVVKVTTNQKEADVAQWLVKHPHPNIAKYYKVWKENNKWLIIMQKVNTNFPSKNQIEKLRKMAERKGYGVENILNYFKEHYMDKKYIPEIVQALTHLVKSKIKLRDFLNPNNMGVVDGVIKLFDIN